MKNYTSFYGSMLFGVSVIFWGNLLRDKYSIGEYLFMMFFYSFAIILSMLMIKEYSSKKGEKKK